jgi:hypothetical protein
MRLSRAPLAAVLAAGVWAIALAAAGPEISTDNLRAHLQFLASDDMKGRANGSPELERAADYIARQFESAGLSPGGTDSWFQTFSLVAGLSVGEGNSLSLTSKDASATLALGEGYYPLGAPADGVLTLADLDVIFAGYGIAAPDVSYDDYAGVNVRDKAVLIFSHEPQEQNPRSRLNGQKPLPQTTLFAKAAAARERGARVLVVIGDPTHFSDQGDYRLFGRDPEAEDTGIPVIRARRKDAQSIVDAFQLDTRARRIDDDLTPRSGPLAGLKLTYAEHLTKNRRSVRNVVGVLSGADDQKRGEAVVIGAHYDHVGVGGHLSVTPDRAGEIHNGADDNASGTSAIIEMARAAVASRQRFPRSLVFVAFAGEERGLLGSAHYASSPRVPITDTVAMLNLDMIGRSKGRVDISGLESAPALEADLKEAAAALPDLTIKREGPGAGRSDDASFLDRRVPALNFFTGFHGDYHRPSDDWERVDVPGTARVAALALELAARLAARPEKPSFVAR